MTDLAAAAHASAPSHDVVIVGGGHNGLTAAAYLAQAGRSVILLERLDEVGGAAVSAQAFPGVEARLSRYSYLVSLLPQRIIDDLRLDIRLARRRYSSYTPVPGNPGSGLLVDNTDPAATAASFAEVGAAEDAEAFDAFYESTGAVARALWPTVTEPLLTRSEARALVGDDELWEALIERPIGGFIESRLTSDLVRGVAATDALIGTFSSLGDPALDQNRCFLYHVIGQGTGEWDVPIGGMGAVTGELARVAREAGARIVTGAEVTAIHPDGSVDYVRNGHERRVEGRHVLVNAAPDVLDALLGEEPQPPRPRAEGAQVKVNLLLKRLPRLRDESVAPEAAFGGTFHINETYTQLEEAYAGMTRGVMPELLPCEIYCHTLADPTILDPELAESGAQTITVFGLHTPDRWLTDENNDATRQRLQDAVLASLDSVLAEPIESLLLTDADGRPCIETKTTRDLERALNMPGGNIFHGPLSWPFAEDDDALDTPAQRWGVATRHPRILLCGSGARRGGAVSGLGGHNAAMAVLEG
ncbi:NAD(P)/FAD-dependent oxidoreductase [Leifsonia sp. F6_8S_P_1B]|uniref:Pyridine nucleotide-disulfide oxidoreductase domain-containing protein 2 n=1 Tax=Leifsonia williamsii TaxID=3035919 RepID=A0ABT8K8A8_9MICO|nr:NAD(P)/FAD-dependent oxidoreductase [Leifsonia williamsii]MDN4613695.1 NAD(P)/FAD-dependent oxidoreductase [Leifsonia williamsii]